MNLIPYREVRILLVIQYILKFLVVCLLPLTEDEAYYSYWAKFPDFGYFDHPPIVAWLSSLVGVFPSTPLATRVGVYVLSLLTVPIFFSFLKKCWRHKEISTHYCNPMLWFQSLRFNLWNIINSRHCSNILLVYSSS